MLKVLGLDPSSTRTGYAIMRGAADLVEAGTLTPCRRADPPVQRIADIGDELRKLCAEQKPDWAVVEIPSGHIHGRLIGGAFNGAGMAIYGMAVGYMLRVVREALPIARVECVPDTVWTAATPKRKRQGEIAALFAQYRAAQREDRGADAADAIGLLLYWFAVRAIEQARTA